MNKGWLQIALGVLTATGGFVDVGAISTAGAAGSTFGFGLVWAMLLGTLAIMLLVEMSGRLAAVSGKPTPMASVSGSASSSTSSRSSASWSPTA